jgi:hypothetical protein
MTGLHQGSFAAAGATAAAAIVALVFLPHRARAEHAPAAAEALTRADSSGSRNLPAAAARI